MKYPLPDARDVDELLGFRDKLYSLEFKPFDGWEGRETGSQEICTLPYPIYNATVEAFFNAASKECWADFGYSPDAAEKMLQDASSISSASFPQLKSMLTFCVRGERFCDGHWAAMIEEGHIGRLLDRLQVLRQHRVP